MTGHIAQAGGLGIFRVAAPDATIIAALISAGALILASSVAAYWRTLAAKRVAQDQELQRATQLMGLVRELGGEEPRQRVIAASLLVERLQSLRLRMMAPHEQRTIIVALISATKFRPAHAGLAEEARAHAQMQDREFTRFIAENLARLLGAVKDDRVRPLPGHSLKDFDWQGARMDGSWLPGFDGSGLDLWRSSFAFAGLNDARFVQAVLKDADFTRSALRRAMFDGADLRGADFTGANLEGASFKGAKYDGETVFPPGFDPLRAEMAGREPAR